MILTAAAAAMLLCGTAAAAETEAETAVQAQAETEAAAEAESAEAAPSGAETASSDKPRLLVTQDAEVDDMNSLIHLLLYANDIDIAGIVQTSSKLHYSGDEETEPLRWTGTDWMYEFLDAYAEVYPCLSAQDPEYPDPEALRAVTVIGNITNVDESEQVTEGSELIRSLILDDDPRTLYIAVGGGSNTLARALKSIEEEYGGTDEWEDIYTKVCDKVIINTWGKQDSCMADYILVNWDGMRIIDVGNASQSYGYSYAKTDLTVAARKKMEGSWMYEKLLNGHGALMDLYATWGDGKYYEGEDADQQFGSDESMLSSVNWWGGKLGLIYNRYDFLSEGDSLDWMRLIPTGLRSLEDETYGGWGGRYIFKGDKDNENVQWYAQSSDENSLAPWIEAIQDDFAARVAWCTAATCEEANHAPAVEVEEGLDLTASAGEELVLHTAVSDPDGDEVSVTAWQYAEADTYEGEEDSDGIDVSVSEDGEVSLTVPEDAQAGDTLHVIIEAKDAATLAMRAYQRVIVTVE